MTHEGFADRHPHPPHPYRVTTEDIDWQQQSATKRHQKLGNDRHESPSIDGHQPFAYRVQLCSIHVARLNALRNPSKPSETLKDNNSQQSEDKSEPMVVKQTTEGRTLRRRKEKVPRHLKRGANEKEMDNFTKGFSGYPWISHSMRLILPTDCRCSSEKPSRLNRTLRGSSISALCDTSSSVNIIPNVMADHLGLEIEPSKDLFTFVDYSKRNSGGIIRNLEVKIGNALVPVDLRVLDIKLNWNYSLLLVRDFMATIGAVCKMQTNKLCLTLIDPNVYYDPVRVVKCGNQNSHRRDLVNEGKSSKPNFPWRSGLSM
ncbi:hypothetical protein F2Q68_00039235 [Brassica cretica]|uniref:Aspartic peptidase DDI1-type domain-containing protein n=1 Tax=Brassica cretica TaxID=69181 RepID=A0A8S9MMZ1_BRACR|nr:hypothetical protein F2Q68_00039235 [Brassica cretica]